MSKFGDEVEIKVEGLQLYAWPNSRLHGKPVLSVKFPKLLDMAEKGKRHPLLTEHVYEQASIGGPGQVEIEATNDIMDVEEITGTGGLPLPDLLAVLRHLLADCPELLAHEHLWRVHVDREAIEVQRLFS